MPFLAALSLLSLFWTVGNTAFPVSDLPAFEKNTVYLICSGSRHKQGFIAKDFNLIDRNATHIGLGLVEKNELMVYNVNVDHGGQSALQAESLPSFTGDQGTRYYSIWAYRSSTQEMKKLKRILRKLLSTRITFDMEFEANNNKLYCSEFCAMVLQQWKPQLFCYTLSTKTLNGLYKSALNRAVLHYFPVDFFQVSCAFRKVYECYLE